MAMKIVIVSDNHGIRCLDKIRNENRDAIAFIHCGDSCLPDELLDGYAGVLGNCDIYADLPLSRVVEVNGLRIYVEHGNDVGNNLKRTLVTRAKEEDCSVICYGHTHRYAVEEEKGILMINPGSLRYNRDDMTSTYAVLTVFDDGKMQVERREIDPLKYM